MKDLNIPAVPLHPGYILQHEFLEPMGLTQTALAKHLGIPHRRINEICRGKRSITAETAWMLAQAFGTSPEFWLNGQAIYELAVARSENRLKNIEKICA